MESNRRAVLADWTTALEVCTVEIVSQGLTFVCKHRGHMTGT